MQPAFSLGQPAYITETPSSGSFAIVQDKTPATIWIDENDYPGVVRAAGDLRIDVMRVTGVAPAMVHDASVAGDRAIIIGTIGKSPVIDRIIRQRKIDVSRVTGQWEAFMIESVANPVPGVASGLIVAGSDKRGTIYGIYDLSEQMGVSPAYFFTDIPAQHHDALFVAAGEHSEGPPSFKYRGIFINDEAPDLTGWVRDHYGDYNHGFYTNVFEMLLRMKANYLWPAMWNNCFSEDDPLNPELADEYGIVMGTSHVEPMMRADREWNRKGYTTRQWNFDTNPDLLKTFWRQGIERNKGYENIITIAMRGKVDTPMSETANIALLERIVAAQRNIIADVMHTNVAAVPQLWALYKEVQEYYEKGMRVPDDVTLLWCDDNWGNIRRLPSVEEQKRSGGAGIYYHFDYVGGPRNYKWVDTVPLPRVWEQMNQAISWGADRIWVVNVGHMLHVTFPIEFSLAVARDAKVWPKERIAEFPRLWAEREFGPAQAAKIADILTKYGKYNGRRKPELLAPTTFSLVSYDEADSVVADWKALAAEADEVSQSLPADRRDAFYELVLYPVKACANLNELLVDAGKNRLYATQGRASANDLAQKARDLFKTDAEMSAYYNHTLENGKWDHAMDQVHIGYTSWQDPRVNIMPRVNEVEPDTNANMGVAIEGSTDTWPGATDAAALPQFDVFTQPRHYIDVFNKGQTAFPFTLAASAPWIQLSAAQGTVEKEQRIWVNVDWSKVPPGDASGTVTINGAGTNGVIVKVDAFNPAEPTRDSLTGFVESGGCVSVEAVHYTAKVAAGAARWEPIDDLGRTLSSMSIFPMTAASITPPENSPRLEYKMYLFNPGDVEVQTIISPSLNTEPGRGLRFALSFDDQPPQIVTAVPSGYFVDNGVRDWEESVRNNARITKTSFTVANTGYHTLKVWMVDPGVVLQKLVVNLGGVKPSYLGPPESYHRTN